MTRTRKPLTEEQKAKLREANKRWRAKNADKFKAIKERWTAENREKVNGYNRVYKAKNRERMNEYNRQYRRKLAKIAAMLDQQDGEEIRVKVLNQNEVFAAARNAVPRGLPSWKREDIISDIVLAVLEGRLSIDRIATSAKDFIKDHNRMFDHLSTVQFNDDFHGHHAATY